MIITIEQAEDIRKIESKLKESLNFDQYNSFHISKLLNEKVCNQHLDDCVAPNYCKHLYVSFIYPIYFYLEYTNCYLTVDKIAEHYGYESNDAQNMINEGDKIINQLVKLGY
jgi:hypothetical protein